MSNQSSHANANAGDAGRLSPELPLRLNEGARGPSPTAASPIRAPPSPPTPPPPQDYPSPGGLADGDLTMAQPDQKPLEAQELVERIDRERAADEIDTESDNDNESRLGQVFDRMIEMSDEIARTRAAERAVNASAAADAAVTAAAAAAAAADAASESKSGGGGGGGGGAAYYYGADVKNVDVHLFGRVAFRCPAGERKRTEDMVQDVFSIVCKYISEDEEKKKPPQPMDVLPAFVRDAVDKYEYFGSELYDAMREAIDLVALWIIAFSKQHGMNNIKFAQEIAEDELLMEIVPDMFEPSSGASAASNKKRAAESDRENESAAKRAKTDDNDGDAAM